MTPQNVSDIFSTFSGDIGNILAENLPLVVGILSALIGLGILVSYVARWLGSRDGTLTYEMEQSHDLRNRTWKGGGNEM